MDSKVLLLGGALAAGGLLLATGSAHAQCGPAAAAGEETTITASVVDMSCYLVQGLHGADHKMCAEICAKQGVPLVFLTADGELVLPVSNAMPSSSFNDQLVGHAEEKVKVTGTVVKKAGSKAITVEKIEAAT